MWMPMCRDGTAHAASAITLWRRDETQEATPVGDYTQELIQTLDEDSMQCRPEIALYGLSWLAKLNSGRRKR